MVSNLSEKFKFVYKSAKLAVLPTSLMSFNTTFVQVTSVYSLQTVSCGPKSSGISKQGQDDTKAFRFPYQKGIEERKNSNILSHFHQQLACHVLQLLQILDLVQGDFGCAHIIRYVSLRQRRHIPVVVL